MRYRVSFDRVGRNHEWPDLTTDASTMDELAAKVYDHVRPGLQSQGIEVHANGGERRGMILAGWNNGGTFTFEEVGAS